jgi:ABC-type polysaccharide/polyol phosphate transport system ATPase subunit
MGASQPAIRIERLGKYFGAPVDLEGARSPRESWRALRRIFGMGSDAGDGDIQRTVTIPGHVLRDISLEIAKGSVVCLAGSSGSGKSVLLKILAGVMLPTTGRVELRGSVCSLVDLGGALDGRMTAYENIENYCSLARFPSDAKYVDDVIDFAELRGFESVPVRTYSKGMWLRLTAALAFSAKPSILLLDDVLAVGDIGFQQKCVERLHVLATSGCTVVAALSDEELVAQIASRVITLSSGRVVDDALPKSWHTAAQVSSDAHVEWEISANLPEDDVMVLRSLSLQDVQDGGGACVCLSHEFEAKVGPLRCRPSIFLMRDKTVICRSLYPDSFDVDAASRVMLTVRIPTYMLADGNYRITSNMYAVHGNVNYSLKADAVALRVRRTAESDDESTSQPLLTMAVPWEIERIATDQP